MCKWGIDDGWIMCEVCGKRIEKTINNKKYCDECAETTKKEQDFIADKKYKSKARRESDLNL